MIRPSSLPMIAECPCFESGPTEWTDGGTNRHRYLHLLYLTDAEIHGDIMTPENSVEVFSDERKQLQTVMSDEEIEACEWAYEYIKLTAALNDHPIHFERTMKWLRPDFSEAEGTPDVSCGQDLFDLKWRERNHHAQMADYALAKFEEADKLNQPLKFVRVHLLFGALKKKEVYTMTRDQAERIVEQTLATTRQPSPQPVACDYCGWCKKNLTCPATTQPVKQMAVAITDGKPPEITTWKISEIDTLEKLIFALLICRNIIKPWCSELEKFALKCAKDAGWSLAPDFELVTTKGRSYITDVQQCFVLSGLTQEEFFKCVEVRMNTSKKYPDKIGLTEIFAKKNEMKMAPAKRALLAKLETVIKQGATGVKLKSKNDESEGDE